MDNPADAAPLFTAFDIGVLVVLLISAVLAYARGFVHEVLAIAGWIGAIFATIYGFPYLQPHARQVTDINIVADLGAGVVVFVVALVLCSVVTRAIAKKVKQSALNAVDRSLGFLFGLVRGAVVVVIAYIGLGLVYPVDNQPEWIRGARSMELVHPGAAMLTALIPDSIGGGGEAPADDAGKPGAKDTQKAAPKDPKRVVHELLAPKPKAPDKAEKQGYDEKERRDMERLHDSIQQR